MKKIVFALIITMLSVESWAQKSVTLEDFTVNGTFAVNRVGGLRSSSSGERYMTLSPSRRQILEYSYKTGTLIDTIIDLDKLEEAPAAVIDDYSINAPGTWMLIQTKTSPIYRRSFTAEYYIYEFRNKDIMRRHAQVFSKFRVAF